MLRAAAGHPSQLQIMYGLSGERRLQRDHARLACGYEKSQPVRIGNARLRPAADRRLRRADGRAACRRESSSSNHRRTRWHFQKVLLEEPARRWPRPDKGIWEIRSGRAALHAFEADGLGRLRPRREGRWRISACPARSTNGERCARRSARRFCANGWSDSRQSFVQTYGGEALDASLLLIPLVGFLPAERSARHLDRRGDPARADRGRPGASLPARPERRRPCRPRGHVPRLQLLARRRALHDRPLRRGGRSFSSACSSLRNDLGLLAEEYDPRTKRQLGNFPQAFSHVGIVNTRNNLLSARGPAAQRAGKAAPTQHEETKTQTGIGVTEKVT